MTSRLGLVLLSIVLVLQLITAGVAIYMAVLVADVHSAAMSLQSTATSLADQARGTLDQVNDVTADLQGRMDALDQAVDRLQGAFPFLR